ncbi:MAG: hypothetical protein HYV68_03260 [Candidatus Taylorbacteria bacterium]|nr:hypothetical protein [Candidatus Taylorbacteria bacterium]
MNRKEEMEAFVALEDEIDKLIEHYPPAKLLDPAEISKILCVVLASTGQFPNYFGDVTGGSANRASLAKTFALLAERFVLRGLQNAAAEAVSNLSGQLTVTAHKKPKQIQHKNQDPGLKARMEALKKHRDDF